MVRICRGIILKPTFAIENKQQLYAFQSFRTTALFTKIN